MDEREFDLIIFGASGFTGFYVIRELLLTMEKSKLHLKWAVAGRNVTRLLDKLNQISAELNKDLSSVVKIVADVEKDDTLIEMAKRTRLIVNCVGPYHLWGRPVVKACVEAATHHVDISGEPQYIEAMQLEFHHQALEKGILIISTCGWDSIPCDLGVDFMKRNFDGRLHSVESFMKTFPGPHGYRINFGTLDSVIHGYRHKKDLRALRQRLYSEVLSKKIPASRIILRRKNFPFKHPHLNGYNVEFPGSDRSVVLRSQYYNYQNFGEFPLQMQTYFSVPSLVSLFGLIMFGIVLVTLVSCSWGRRLLRAYPEFFSAGFFSHHGPSRAQIESTTFQLNLFGKGWSKEVLNKISDAETEPLTEFDQTITVKVSGRDPGYMATSACLIQSAVTILIERASMPSGGVMTPASAFRSTNIIERLSQSGLKFEIISKQKTIASSTTDSFSK